MSSPTPGSVTRMAAIRTLALVGPAAAGKTSLAEALLAKTGAIGAAGTLERGSTVSDFDPLERKMGHSLNAAVMHALRNGQAECAECSSEESLRIMATLDECRKQLGVVYPHEK